MQHIEEKPGSWQTRFNPEGVGVDTDRKLVVFRRYLVDDQGDLKHAVVCLNTLKSLILFILENTGSLSAPFSPIMYYLYTHGLQDLTASLHFQ